MGTITAILILVLYGLMLVGGIYFKSYFDKKGENLATKEDFKDLKTQTAELRQTTKEIEAKIDDQVWNRQRQWELKRDILFDATKRLSDADNKLLSLNTFWQHKIDGQIGSEEQEVRFQHKFTIEWQTSMRSFEEVEALTQVTCSIETMTAFTQLKYLLGDTAAKIVSGDKIVYVSSQKEREKRFGLAKLAIRKELGIATSVMPLSSGSSPAPTLE
jgi:hypothetical protein